MAIKSLKIAFLASVTSGTGKGSKIRDRLPAVCRDLGLETAQYRLQTIATHDVMLQSADLAKKTERLVVIGGDGIAAAVLAGVRAGREDIPVGVIPVGTGNDLARVTGTHRTLRTHGLKACVRCCLHADAVPIDIWRINEKYFMVNYLSVGMDAAVVDSFSRHRHKRRTPYPSSFINFCIYGFFGFHHLFAGVKGTTTLQNTCGEYGQTHRFDDLRELIISNIPSYAAGTMPSPDADYADRCLDVTTFGSILRFAALFLVQPSRRLQNWYGRTLTHYRGEKIELRLAPGNFLQIDGEDKTHILEDTDIITIEHEGQGLVIRSR